MVVTDVLNTPACAKQNTSVFELKVSRGAHCPGSVYHTTCLTTPWRLYMWRPWLRTIRFAVCPSMMWQRLISRGPWRCATVEGTQTTEQRYTSCMCTYVPQYVFTFLYTRQSNAKKGKKARWIDHRAGVLAEPTTPLVPVLHLEKVSVPAHLLQQDLKLSADPVPAVLAVARVPRPLSVDNQGGPRMGPERRGGVCVRIRLRCY